MAEAFLRDAAARRHAPATISSAGVRTHGTAASAGSTRAIGAYGLALDTHRSRRLDEAMIRQADLVLTMETAHVRDAAVLAPDRFGSIYTIREFVERAAAVGPRGGEPLDRWLALLGDGRTAAGVLAGTGLDVDDPYGGPDAGYDACAAQLSELCEAVADTLWGPA
jgi:protein-tyrosine phosphatase